MFRRVDPTRQKSKKGFRVDDRWPYPVAQKMQRQTGNRIAPVPLSGTPPIAPDATKDKDNKEKSFEPSSASKVEQHLKD